MTKKNNIVHVHLISDSTTDTLVSLLHAVINGYDAEFKEHLYPVVRSQAKLQNAMDCIEKYGGVVLTTLVDDKAQKTIAKFCKKKELKFMPALEPLTKFFDSHLGQTGKRKVGSKYTLDDKYFERIAALDYTLEHDDGAKLDTIYQADIVLLGISRTSKTPTSVYLAHRGHKVANIPFIMEMKQNLSQINYGNAFIVGLFATPVRIMQVRQNRMSQMNADPKDDYADLRMIIEEVRESKNLFENLDIPYIDVTRRAIEETAAMIIQMKVEKTLCRKDRI